MNEQPPKNRGLLKKLARRHRLYQATVKAVESPDWPTPEQYARAEHALKESFRREQLPAGTIPLLL